ncbi:hypothetical protein D3C72_1818160 [compost metagenome]
MILPKDGRKLFFGSSALMRNCRAKPRWMMSSCLIESSRPEAMRICSRTMSIPVISSVMVCSTWTRVFISMKYTSPSARRNSTVPAFS